jgi:hypothetical protein
MGSVASAGNRRVSAQVPAGVAGAIEAFPPVGVSGSDLRQGLPLFADIIARPYRSSLRRRRGTGPGEPTTQVLA